MRAFGGDAPGTFAARVPWAFAAPSRVSGSLFDVAEAGAFAAEHAEPPVTDWTLRPFARARRSPLWVGLVLAFAFFGASLLVRIAFSDFALAPWRNAYFWLDVLSALLFGYVPAASMWLRRGRLRDLRELRPCLRPDEGGYARLETEVVCVPPRRLAASGLAGALLLGALPVLDPGFWEGRPPRLLSLLMLFFVARMGAMGWLVGHAVATEATAAAALGRLGRERLRVDLLDLRPLAPLARSGLRSAFAWVLATSLISLFWLGPAAGRANGPIVAVILVLLTLAFFASIGGAHRSLRAAKREALDRLSGQIRRASEELLTGRTRQGAPLADLLALHEFLSRAREWPLGAPALLRGGLIAAMALGSWLAGAVVERLIDRAFG